MAIKEKVEIKAVKKRCIRCLKVLRDNGTCQNPSCPKYVPEKEDK